MNKETIENFLEELIEDGLKEDNRAQASQPVKSDSKEKVDFGDGYLDMPMIALRGKVLFPDTVFSFDVGRPFSVKAVQKAADNHSYLFLAAQKNPAVDAPTKRDVFSVGSIAKIKSVASLGKGNVKVCVESLCRGEIEMFLSDKESDLFYGYPIGNSFSKLSPTDAPTIFPERDKGNNKVLIRVGLTNLNKEIIMNSQYDNTRRKMHEIFHTLFFNQDDAPSGIGNYVPGVDMPTQEDINILLNNSQLPSIYE